MNARLVIAATDNAMMSSEMKGDMKGGMKDTMKPMSYMLMGGDLKAHVGHKVEVTGMMADHRLAVASHEVAGLARTIAQKLGIDVGPKLAPDEGRRRWIDAVADDETEARRIAHAQWAAPAAIPPRLLTKLRVPADFQAVADLVTEEQVCETVLCEADPELHLAKIKEFADAGFDHVHVHQVGADQETLFRFYEREVLPRVRQI